MRVALKLACNDLKKTFKSIKIYLIILMTLFFILEVADEVNAIANMANVGVTPFLYPMFVSSYSGSLYTILLIVVLMSDAPYECGAELYIKLRVKKEEWYLGKVIYIFLMSLIYQAIMILVSIIGIAKNMAFSSSWGEALENYWSSINNGFTIAGDAHATGLLEMTPIKAIGLQLLFAVLISVLVGCLIFIINVIFKNFIGTILVGSLSLLQFYFSELRFMSGKIDLDFGKYVPVSWLNLNSDERAFSYNTEAWILIGLIAIVFVLGLMLSKSKRHFGITG